MRPPFNQSHDYSASISQGERLASYASARFDEEMKEEATTISAPPDGFKMPSMSKVREHDAILSLRGSSVNVSSDDSDDDETDDESALREQVAFKRRDSMREHSLLMPSQRGFREAWSEAASYGYAND